MTTSTWLCAASKMCASASILLAMALLALGAALPCPPMDTDSAMENLRDGRRSPSADVDMLIASMLDGPPLLNHTILI